MKKSKIHKFRVELEHKVAATSFVEVEAKDSTEAFTKAMHLIKGQKVKGVFGLRADISDMKQEKYMKPVKSLQEIEFDYPDHADPHKVRIAHVTEE